MSAISSPSATIGSAPEAGDLNPWAQRERSSNASRNFFVVAIVNLALADECLRDVKGTPTLDANLLLLVEERGSPRQLREDVGSSLLALISGHRWDPLDMSAVEQIRQFELGQPSATHAIVERPNQVLRMTQALLLNATARALSNPARAKEHETPLFFCLHTIIDDFRQAELNFTLGYTVAVTWALRDAIEAVALATLLWREPKRARAYWDGAEFKPSQVRKDLESLGLWSVMVGSMWTTYTMLSGLTHPTIDRLAQVMDERRTEEGVIHTFNAGGTRNERKLRLVQGLIAGCCVDIVILVGPIMETYLSRSDYRILDACLRDIARKAAEVLESGLSQRQAEPEEPKEASEYARRLSKRLAKPMAMFEGAVLALRPEEIPKSQPKR